MALILGIESSCDETGIALYRMGEGMLAHGLHTQIAMHNEYGGVVPELASRDHIRRVLPLIRQVTAEAGCSLQEIAAIAYTQGPGLSGALLVGSSVACALAYALDVPTIPIHHLEGHLLSPLLSDPAPEFPFIALLVSGGHTQLMRVDRVGEYALLGETLDDAAGEAFDKSAKLLGLDYPGGALLSKLAENGTPGRFKLPRPMLHSGDLDFSFSGLKTAVMLAVRQNASPLPNPLDKTTSHSTSLQTTTGKSLVIPQAGEGANESLREFETLEQTRADIAYETQAAIVDVLAGKAIAALKRSGLKQLVVAGGVGANRQLRAQLNQTAEKKGFSVFYPDMQFCTDNGAMIAFAGALRLKQGKKDYRFDVKPRWDLQNL